MKKHFLLLATVLILLALVSCDLFGTKEKEEPQKPTIPTEIIGTWETVETILNSPIAKAEFRTDGKYSFWCGGTNLYTSANFSISGTTITLYDQYTNEVFDTATWSNNQMYLSDVDITLIKK